MAATPPTTPLIVLLPGAGVHLLGQTAHARNARVAERVGAVVAAPDELAENGDRPAVLVPSSVLIERPLFLEPLPPTIMRLVVSNGLSHAAVIAGPSHALARYCANPTDTPQLPQGAAPAGSVLDVSSASAKRAAIRQILRGAGKATDGWVAARLNRPISRLVSRMLLALGFNAWHASILTLAVGIATGFVAAQPGYAALVVTGILFHLTSVLDGVDGEIARATLTESDAGARLDAIVDHATYLACFAGVTVGWAREGRAMDAVAWTAAVGVALALTLVRAWFFVSKYAPDASFVFIDRSVRRAARDSRRGGLKVAPALFRLMRRDLFALIFLGVSLTGLRVLMPVLVGIALAVANLTFSIYRRELVAAALVERSAPA